MSSDFPRPPLRLAGSRRGADGRPRHDCVGRRLRLDRSVAAVRRRGRMARGRGRSARRDAPSEHRNRHPAVASTACSLKRRHPARVVDSPPSATQVETSDHAAVGAGVRPCRVAASSALAADRARGIVDERAAPRLPQVAASGSVGAMSLETWWPLLQPETRDWLIANNGDALSTPVLDDITRVGGPLPRTGGGWARTDRTASTSPMRASTGSRPWPMERCRTPRPIADNAMTAALPANAPACRSQVAHVLGREQAQDMPEVESYGESGGGFIRVSPAQRRWYGFVRRSGLFAILAWLDNSVPGTRGRLGRLYGPWTPRR